MWIRKQHIRNKLSCCIEACPCWLCWCPILVASLTKQGWQLPIQYSNENCGVLYRLLRIAGLCRCIFDTDNIDIGPERRNYLDHRLSRVWEYNGQVSLWTHVIPRVNVAREGNKLYESSGTAHPWSQTAENVCAHLVMPVVRSGLALQRSLESCMLLSISFCCCCLMSQLHYDKCLGSCWKGASHVLLPCLISLMMGCAGIYPLRAILESAILLLGGPCAPAGVCAVREQGGGAPALPTHLPVHHVLGGPPS